MSGNRLVTCPYDEAHKMKESRLQLHITKCKLNNLDKLKKKCPFNATHLLEQGEFDYHLMNCPDRAPLDRAAAQAHDKNNPFKGHTAVPHFSDPHVDTEESWDTEITQTTVRRSSPPPGAIIEPPEMSKPAERRMLYQTLHQLPSEQVPAPKSEKSRLSLDKEVLRQPKQKSQSEETNAQQGNTTDVGGLGMGRGRPSRIAANFGNATNGSVSYSNMVKDFSHLGLSRGRPVNQDSLFEKEEFPALGCGRGSVQSPKQQTIRTPGARSGK